MKFLRCLADGICGLGILVIALRILGIAPDMLTLGRTLMLAQILVRLWIATIALMAGVSAFRLLRRLHERHGPIPPW